MAVLDRSRGGYRVFVGDLGSRVGKHELEREFEVMGDITDVWVARNPPGFAFLVFKYSDDAERAVRKLHGRLVCGRRVRVEHAIPYGERTSAMRNNRHSGDYRYTSHSYSRSRSKSRSQTHSSIRKRRRQSRSLSKENRYKKSKRSRSYSRSHSRSRSPMNKRSRNGRSSPSPARKNKSRTYSRSRSRSRSNSMIRSQKRKKSRRSGSPSRDRKKTCRRSNSRQSTHSRSKSPRQAVNGKSITLSRQNSSASQGSSSGGPSLQQKSGDLTSSENQSGGPSSPRLQSQEETSLQTSMKKDQLSPTSSQQYPELENSHTNGKPRSRSRSRSLSPVTAKQSSGDNPELPSFDTDETDDPGSDPLGLQSYKDQFKQNVPPEDTKSDSDDSCHGDDDRATTLESRNLESDPTTPATGSPSDIIVNSSDMAERSINLTDTSSDTAENSINLTGTSSDTAENSINLTGTSSDTTGDSINLTSTSSDVTGDSINLTGDSINLISSCENPGDSSMVDVEG